MLWAVKQLGTPFRYLAIRQGKTLFRSKAIYDWVLPAVLSATTTALTLYFSPTIELFTDKGIVGGFQKLLEILVPFYIVALAAVATFASENLDAEMKGHPATLHIRMSDGRFVERTLKLRQFICYLFGYLSTMSLIVFVVVLILGFIEKGASMFFDSLLGPLAIYGKGGIMFLSMLAMWQIIITTLLGIYFISERLQFMDEPDI